MTSSSSSAVGGFLCAQEDHSGDQAIGADKTHTWTESTNVAYYPQYTCYDTTSSSVSVAYAAIFGSATYTATNWLAASATEDNTRHWSAALLWTLGAGTVNGFNNGCDVSDEVWSNPPQILTIDTLSVTGLPDDNTLTAGQQYTFTATAKPASVTGTVGLMIDGIGVASGNLANGTAVIKWTPPVAGSHKLSFGFKGNSSNTGAQTTTVGVNIVNGVSTTISSITPIVPSATNSATAAVAVTPTSQAGNVAILDVDALDSSGNPSKVGMGTLSNGSANVTMTPIATPGTTHRYVASVLNSSKQSIGLSAPFSWKTMAPSTVTLTGVPTSPYQYSHYTTLTANFSSAYSATNGVVYLYDNGTQCCSAVLPTGSSTSVTFTDWNPQTSGNHSLYVSFPGSNTDNISGSVSATQTVNVGAGIPLQITSVAKSTTTSGKATATISVGSGYTGTVSLYSSANIYADANGTLQGSGKPSNGQVSISFSFPTSGSGTINLNAYIPATKSPYEWSNTAKFQYGTSSSGAMTGLSSAGIDKGPSIDERIGYALKQAGLTPAAKKPAPGHPAQGASAAPSGAGVETGASQVNQSMMVPKTGSRSLSSTCPTGTVLLHADALTSGPVDGIDVTMSDTGATFVAPSQDAGHEMRTQLICRQAEAALLASAGYALGTPRADVIALTAVGGTAFAGPGDDRVASKAAKSAIWGGLGDDSLLVTGVDSSADGGAGRDRIVANGKIRALLVGGIGRDLLIGSTGASVINSVDGLGGDRVICRSSSTRVVADRGDKITGPCTNITYMKP